MHAFSMQVFGVPLRLAEFPVLKSLRGLGLSDDPACAQALAAKFDYRNTFYHQPPQFDILADPAEEAGTYDFILAGDIFEHVDRPPEVAFRNAFRLLKPDGFLAMTVPYLPAASNKENFPPLHDYALVKTDSGVALVNRTETGEWQVFDGLVFHGGPGATLEMRVFGENDLRSDLASTGFTSVEFATENYPPFGIVHRETWSLPLLASRRPFRLPRAALAEIASQFADEAERCRRAQAEQVRLEDLCCELNRHLDAVNADLRAKASWALTVQADAARSAAEVVRLQREETRLGAELESRTAAACAMESELRGWAAALEKQAADAGAEIRRLQGEFEERTAWALKLRDELAERTDEAARLAQENDSLRRRLEAWEMSRWSHFGQALGLGPKFPDAGLRTETVTKGP